MGFQRLGLLGLAAGVALVLAACAAEADHGDAAGRAPTLQLLERIRSETPDSPNPFLGRGQLRELRAQRDAAAPGAARWAYLGLLGLHELRVGDTEQAVADYLEAYRELTTLGASIPPDKAQQAVYDLGVAYLRLGESQNCQQRHNADSCLLPLHGGGLHVKTEGSEQAIRYFGEVLRSAPAGSLVAIKARWLMNIASMTLGRYPDGVPEAWRIDPKVFASDEPFPHFVNIAPAMGLARFNLAGGAIADDFDGDADLDLLLSSSDTGGPMAYYENTGDGRFADRTEAAGLRGLYGGLNMVQADYDNDGDVDVLVLRGAWWREWGRHPNSLLRNDGAAHFTDVTDAAGLAEPAYPTQTGAWGDYDNDGDLDLFVGNELSEKVRAPCQLFRNNGDGTFSDVAAQAGVENNRFTKAAVWGDYDGDRFPDLFLSNIGHEKRLYHNNRDGTFTDVAPKLGMTQPISTFPAWWWDFNNDGALDVIVWGYGGSNRLEVGDIAASYLGLPNKADLPHLWQGDGHGGFREVAASVGLTRASVPMGSNFGDLDNDGWLDVYLGTGYPFYEALMPNVMLHNRAGTRFSDVSTAGGFANLQKGHAVVFADLDNDGDQDVYEVMGGGYLGDAAANTLFENPGFGNHWIKVKTVGAKTNRGGIGARIRLEVIDAGQRRSIYKTVNSGGSFGGNPLRQELGVGAAARIERLEIFWPTSNTTQTFRDVAVDQAIEVTEGKDELRPIPLKRFAFAVSSGR